MLAAASLALALFAAGPAFAQQNAQGQAQNPATDMDLNDVTVYGEADSGDQLIGPYDQPAWTARQQRWGTTRAYVLPPGRFELETFATYTEEEGDGVGPEWEFQQELKIGLPYRIQLDLYYVAPRPAGGEIESQGYKIELRHALADWGEIWMNPTLYAEYEAPFNGADGSEVIEGKLLLAETLAPKTHFATNLIYEQYLHEDKIEYGVSGGISYTVVENAFSVGAEGEVIKEDAGSEQKVETLLGPSFEWRPTGNTSLRVSPLFGIGSDSPDIEAFAVFGIGFGPGEESGAEYIGPAGSEMR
jgi:hypothetical protein